MGRKAKTKLHPNSGKVEATVSEFTIKIQQVIAFYITDLPREPITHYVQQRPRKLSAFTPTPQMFTGLHGLPRSPPLSEAQPMFSYRVGTLGSTEATGRVRRRTAGAHDTSARHRPPRLLYRIQLTGNKPWPCPHQHDDILSLRT